MFYFSGTLIDVNGKVIHVVERPPPSARISTSNSNENRRTRNEGHEGGVRGSPIFRALDGMVVGAMTIPVNASGGVIFFINYYYYYLFFSFLFFMIIIC